MAIGKIVLGAGLIAMLAIPGCMIINTANTANEMENGIKAQYDQNKNVLSKMSNSVMESAQVPEMAKDNLKEVIEAAMQGRYENDKGLLAKSVTEAYPGTLDTAMYNRLIDLIQSGRTDFAAEQQKLIDKTRTYKTKLGRIPDRWLLAIAGYPGIDFKDYDIIVSDYTNDAFTTKIDKGIKIGK